MASLRTLWEQDLGATLPNNLWNAALERVHSSSSSSRYWLIQFKIVHRVHFTKAKLAKIYPSINPACDRCKQAPATLIHMFWTCSALRRLWRAIFNSLSKVSGTSIVPHPLIAIFSVRPENCDWPSNNVRPFATLLILLNWKSSKPPFHVRWIREIMFHVELDMIKFTLRGNLDRFKKVWMPFLICFDNLTNVTNVGTS